jgi:transcription initiation factor TFIIB
MSHSSQTSTCPECEGQLRADGGETVCSTCGLVVAEDQLDRGPEWRSFEAETRERTGAPLTRSRHDRGLSTVIGRGSDQLSGRKRRQLARLRRHHNRAKIGSKAERNQVYAFTEIRRITSSLSLPDSTRDRACMFFERAQEQDLLRGRSVEGFAAAALYAACRVSGLSRTMRELAAVARASPSELQVAYDAMNRDLGLPTGPIDPGEYLPRFASELDVPPIIEQRAQEYATEVREEGIGTGRHPAGVAAACLYAAAKAKCYPLTQDEAADVADVTPVTLRSTYMDLQD